MKSLPLIFPLKKLEEFDFGDSDGARDKKLFSTYCETKSFKKALNGKNTIIIGPRGSGKSALFSLLKKEKIKVKYNRGHDQIIAISDELRYVDIDHIIAESFKSYKYPDEYKYSLIWDLYFIYRIIGELKASFKRKHKKIIAEFNNFFTHRNIEPGLSLSVFLDKLKPSKIKISMTDGSCVYSVETELNKSVEKAYDIPIETLKNDVNNALSSSRKYVHILIDKIDDFLVPAEEEIQKKIIQGLIYTEDTFHDLSNVKITIFLRNDLFKKSDINFIGLEKLRSRLLECNWTKSEILKFMSNRIAMNLFTHLGVRKLNFNSRYFIKGKDIGDLSKTKKIRESNRYDIDDGRMDAFNDTAYLKIIFKIFPKKIKHKDTNGKTRDMPLDEYIMTHLNLANTGPNPRKIIRFLQLCIEESIDYYSENNFEIKPILLDSDYHYPLIKRRSIMNAYSRLSKEIWEERISDDRDIWKLELQFLQRNKGRKKKYTKKEIMKITGIDTTKCDNFLEYATQTGCMFTNDNKNYELPIILKAFNY